MLHSRKLYTTDKSIENQYMTKMPIKLFFHWPLELATENNIFT
jgi:hypothetical protein